jgi:hypothetical protein
MTNTEKEIEHIFDSLRKVLFYAGHGKYNHVMSFEDVQNIKTKLETILDVEKEYEKASTVEEKEAIYKRLEPYKTYSIRDFVDYEIERI